MLRRRASTSVTVFHVAGFRRHECPECTARRVLAACTTSRDVVDADTMKIMPIEVCVRKSFARAGRRATEEQESS
jgi:hypothetical protein